MNHPSYPKTRLSHYAVYLHVYSRVSFREVESIVIYLVIAYPKYKKSTPPLSSLKETKGQFIFLACTCIIIS